MRVDEEGDGEGGGERFRLGEEEDGALEPGRTN